MQSQSRSPWRSQPPQQAHSLTAQRSGEEVHLALAGEWRVAELAEMDEAFAAIDLGGVRRVRIDTTNLSVLDFSAAWRLRDFLERVRQLDGEISFEGTEPE